MMCSQARRVELDASAGVRHRDLSLLLAANKGRRVLFLLERFAMLGSAALLARFIKEFCKDKAMDRTVFALHLRPPPPCDALRARRGRGAGHEPRGGALFHIAAEAKKHFVIVLASQTLQMFCVAARRLVPWLFGRAPAPEGGQFFRPTH